MEPEWLKVATSPGLWIIGFIFADEDISVGGLLAGRRSGETQTSLRRWLQSRKAG